MSGPWEQYQSGPWARYAKQEPEEIQPTAPKEDGGFFSNIGNLLVEGGKRTYGAAKLAPSVISGSVGPEEAAAVAQELQRKPTVQPKALQEAKKAFEDEGEAFAKAQGFRESAGPVLGMIAEFGKQVLTNPAGALYLTSESAANMIPAIVGMLGGAKLGTLGGPLMPITVPAGAIGGAFLGQAPVEAGMEFTGLVGQELSRRNLSPTEANVARVLADQKFVEQAVSQARTKGATTAAIDAAFTVGAGRFATAPGRNAVRTAAKELGEGATPTQIAARADDILKGRTITDKIGRGAGAVGIDVAGGGLSEAGGQLAAYGEVDLADVGLEMLGELGGSAVEVPAAIRSMREPRPVAGPVEPPIPEDLPPVPPEGEAPQVATLPPSGVYTEADVANIPGALDSPSVRRDILGKTRSDLEAIVEENPEILQNESAYARAIRALLEPAGEPDQLGVEPPVPVSGPAGLPGAAGAIPPVGSGVADIGDDVGAPAAPTPSVTPTVTETPSGITTPEAVEAEAQRQEEPITTEPIEDFELPATPADAWNLMNADVRLRAATQAGLTNPENFTNKKWGSLSKTVRGKLQGVIASEQMAEEVAPEPAAVTPRAPRVPREPREPRIKATENPLNIGAPAGTRWQPGTVPETALVTEGAQPFRSKAEAQEAKKGNPEMRMLSVPGGFILTPKTDRQIEADQRAGERLGRARTGQAGMPQNAMEFIAEQGGLNRSAAENIQGVDVRRNPRIGNRFLITKNGMSLAQAAELLKQYGYIDDEFETSAAEAIGNPQAYTAEGFNRLIEIEQEARDQELEQDPYEGTDYEAATAKIKAEVDEILSRADELGIDPEDVYENARSRARVQAEWLGQPIVTDYDYYVAAREELRSVLERGPEDRRTDISQPGEAAPDLELTPPTPEAQAEAERRAAQAPAEQERDQIRRESEVGAGQFRLDGGEGRQDISGRLFQEEITPEPVTFYEDIPNEDWLQGKIDYAVRSPRNEFGVPKMSSITGSFSNPVLVPARFFEGVKGQRGEQDNVRQESLSAIRKIIRETGRMPLTDDGREYVPYVEIGYDGKPFISEGNHRVMAAIAEGMEYIPVELRYFDGGQRRAGKWAPNNLKEITDRVKPEMVGRLFQQESLFREAQVEDSSGRKTQGLVREFDNGQGGTGVINLAISGNRIYPSYVDNGIMNRETKGSGGAVTSVYEDAIQEAQNRGLQFTSDSSVTMDAARVYDSLAKRGYKVNRNPSARIANRPEVVTQRWVTDDGSPVYTVDPKEDLSVGNEMSSILEARTEKGGWKIEPEEQRVEREIAGLDVDGLTQYAVDNAPNEFAREVAQKIQARIRAMAKSGVEMSFTLYTGDRRPILMTNARGMVEYTITKDKPVQMMLKINGAAVIENQAGYPPGTRYETILHELLHMATAPQIAVSKDTQLVKDLNALRNQIVRHFNDKVKAGKLTDFEQKVYDRTINALSTPDEILAWGITDKEMQEFLAGIKVGERTLFDKFVDIIQRVLGLDRPYRSALEEVLRTTDALLDIGVDQIAADTKKRGFMFSPENPRLEEGQIQGTLFQEETPIAKPDSVQGEGKAALNDSRNSILYKPVSGTWDIDPDLKEFGLSDEFFYNWVDKQRDLKRVVDAINATDKRVDAKFNAIEKERTFHGRVAERTRLYGEQELKPVIEMMAKFGLSQRDVGEYLLMRHVPEANRVIAERNPKFVKRPGTGYETSTALKYMRDLDPQKKKQLEAVAKRMDKTLQKMQDMLIEYKIETPDTIQGWRDMYQFYIPLIREDGDFSVSNVMSQGAGYSTAGETSKARTGSEKPINVDQIFTNIALQHERMIVRAEKGRVAQSVFGLGLTRPKPGFWLALDPETNVYWKTLKDLEQIRSDRDNLKQMIESGDLTKSQEEAFKLEVDLMSKIIKKRMEPARAAFAKARDDLAIGLDMTTDEATEMVKQIMMPPMKARYVKGKNKVVYEPNAAFSNKFVFTARINGADKYLLFNGKDPRAARMVGALKNVDGESLSDAMNTVAMITRFFAQMNTQYNPVFGGYNFLRDVQTAALQISNTDIADKRKEVMNGTMPALATIFKILRAERAGKKTEGKDVTEYNRFRLAGGQTGYRDQFSQAEQRAEAIQRLIDPSSWAESKLGTVFTAGGKLKVPMETARKVAAPLFDLLSDYNQTLENAVRFSAFKVAKQKYLDQGMNLEDAEQKAAVISKEITVNFNQKGAKVNAIGALYAFFNASVQGTYMMAKTYAGPLGKKIIAGSLLWGSIQAMMLAMAGFEDDEPPEFVKQRNFVIPYGDGKYLAFPMPLGFNVLPTLSRLATEAVLTGGDKFSEKIVAALDASMDMFNPIGNAGLSGQTIAPTFLDPIVALFENKDWTGQKIAREDFSGLNPTPGFTRSRESSTAVAQGLAEFLNTVSGGTDARRGLISPTADQLEYLTGQIFGGVGREAMKLGKTVEAQFTGEELPFYSVPLIGRFHGNVNEMASVSSAFYRNLTDLNVHKREIESIRENKGDVQAYLRDNPEARLAQMAQAQYRQVQNLRKLRSQALERGDKERAKKLEEQIKIRMQRLNQRYKEMAD
jgi:hypothetical protein